MIWDNCGGKKGVLIYREVVTSHRLVFIMRLKSTAGRLKPVFTFPDGTIEKEIRAAWRYSTLGFGNRMTDKIEFLHFYLLFILLLQKIPYRC